MNFQNVLESKQMLETLEERVIPGFLDGLTPDEHRKFYLGPNMSSEYYLQAQIINYIIERQKQQTTDVKFLDLGSSRGDIVKLACHVGCEGFGIEFSQEIYNIANRLKNIDSAVKHQPKFAYGNFYPSDFKVTFRQTRSTFDELNEEFFEVSRSIDPYKKLGILPQDMDIFYHFQIQDLRELSEFFSIYAKDGAWLIFGHCYQDMFELTLPENVKQIHEGNAIYLFEKMDNKKK